ncbi:MAG: RcpC/CpaB family pilus assembly protein [Solirubrobacteraceae bacterium]
MSNPLAFRRSKHRDNRTGIGLAAVAFDRPLLRSRHDQSDSPAGPRKRHRLTQPLPLAALLLILLALIGYWSVYNQTTRRTQVLIAAHALSAGRVLRTADLRSSGLAANKQLLATVGPASEQNLLVGRALKSAVAAGAPIPETALAGSPGTGDSLTLVVPAMHALAGQLTPGDRVTVLATYAAANGQAQTRAVARNLEILAVGTASGFVASSQTIPVTVALPDPSLASALALANEAGKLDLLRETGPGANAPIPAANAPGAAP